MKTLDIILLLIVFTFFCFNTYSQPWKQYSDSAKFYSDKKNMDKAVEFYSKAKEELKKDSAQTNSYAGICNSIANLYTNMGKYDRAESLYLEAKQIREKIFGKENVDYATSCNSLGRLYRLMGMYDKAEPLILEAKQIKGKVLGKENADYASSCFNLGILYLNMGQYEKAEPSFLEAKQIREKVLGKENRDYASSCNSLGGLYYKRGQYQKAEPLFLEAKQIREKVSGKEHPDYAASCNNLANLYADMGQYEKAEPLYLEAKDVLKRMFGRENPQYASSCNNLAILYKDIGQYDKAESVFLEARLITEKVLGKEHPDYALSCLNLGILYVDIGQYEKAKPLLLEAKQIREKVLGKKHPDYAWSCGSLAALFWNIHQYEKAESLLLEAKQISEEVLGKEHPDYAVNCNNLASLYSTIGQYNKAEPLYLEAKQIWGRILGKEHPQYALSCANLADLYSNMGRYEMAEPLFWEAKEIWGKTVGKERSDYIEVCYSLANLYWNLKKSEKAIGLYEEAFKSQNIQVRKIFRFTSETEKQSYLNKIADLKNYFLSFNVSVYSHYGRGLAYDVSLSSRNLILSSSQQLREAIYNVTDTTIRNKYDTWINVRKQLAFWYTKPLADRPGYVKDLEEQANTQEKELTRISSEFQKQQEQNNISWQTIQQNLKLNEAAIEFVKFHSYNGKRWTDSTYYIALLLTKNDTTPQLIPLFEEKKLNNLMKAGNTYSTITSLYKDEKENAAYNLIWAPVEKHLIGITKIYFAPAGLLHRISFTALPINDHKVLSDKYQLIQLNTTASVANQSENFIDTSDKTYLYGGIKYDVDSATLKQAVFAYHSGSENIHFLTDYAIRGGSWQYLPGTDKEINEIDSMGKQKNYSVIFSSGTAASEESIKALNGKSSPSVLHIATHGFFFPDPKEKKTDNIKSGFETENVFRQSDNPLFRSGLLLAGANNTWKGKQIEGVEDGILTAYEVSNLYLPNTKLVVLSACETGLGDIQGNEGVYGLQRAFKIAGVQNLVMSLWKVPDKETTEFMQEFYKNIFERQQISDAFYNAQTVMKNKYRNEPYKWAAWILLR